MATKANSKPCQTFEIELLAKKQLWWSFSVSTDYYYSKKCNGINCLLWCFSNNWCFIDIFTYFQLSFSIRVYPVRCLSLSFLLIKVAQLEGSKGGDLPLIIIVSSLINKNISERYQDFSALICDCLIIQTREVFAFASVSKFQGIQALKFKDKRKFPNGLDFLMSQEVQEFLEESRVPDVSGVLGSQDWVPLFYHFITHTHLKNDYHFLIL